MNSQLVVITHSNSQKMRAFHSSQVLKWYSVSSCCVIPGITYVGTYRYKEPHENGEQNFIDIAFALVCPLVSLLQFRKA